MTLRDVARYLRPGTSLVLVVSVLVVPIWIWIATAHAEHWFGGQQRGSWSATIRPWSGRLWSLAIVFALSSWTAWYESLPPIKRAPIVDRLIAALLVLSLAVGVASPTWRWLADIGGLTGPEIVGTAALACVPPFVSLTGTAICRLRLRPNLSLPIGFALGLATLALVWEPMR